MKRHSLTGILILIFSISVCSQSFDTWYNNAQQRIDTLRKGNFGITILDKTDQPYSGNISVSMVKHEFPFGMAFDFYEGEINTDTPTETQWMKAAMYKYFNYGVSGNSFKWSGIQPQHTTPNYTNFDHAVQWTQKVGWDLRAHTLLWGGTSYEDDHPMPRWVKDLPTAQAITDTCKMRVTREVTRYKGIIQEYDVINEPLHANYLQSVVGDSINWNCFKWARTADPDAKLFINEYNVEYGWGDAVEYRDLILKIKNKGGPVTGVGMQSHFWNGFRPDVTDFVTQINTIAETGLPIKLTEYDYGGDLTQEQQAADFIKVMKTAFSHPSIEGIICWELCDKYVWRENTGFFDENHKPKLAADTLLYFTKKLWATNFDSVLSESGTFYFDAYYGDYKIVVKFDDTLKVFNVPCLRINEDSVFVLHENDAIIKGPDLTDVKLVTRKELLLIFDKPIDESSLNKYDFRLFATYSATISSVSIDPYNKNIIRLQLTKNILIGEDIAFTYFPGTLSSTDGGKASPIELLPVENIISTDLNNLSDYVHLNIYPNPATNILNIEGLSSESTISIYNSTGILNFSSACNSGETLQIDISHFDNGIYFIKIINNRDAFISRKIIINR